MGRIKKEQDSKMNADKMSENGEKQKLAKDIIVIVNDPKNTVQ
jgi:hypothetical protein